VRDFRFPSACGWRGPLPWLREQCRKRGWHFPALASGFVLRMFLWYKLPIVNEGRGFPAMKQSTVKLLTTAVVFTPAAALVAQGAIESGIDRTECLVETLAPCPTNDVLAVEPDMPIDDGGGTIPIRASVAFVSTNTGSAVASDGGIIGTRLYWR
jgi:hypothetical protein